jgi:hypothetical protein
LSSPSSGSVRLPLRLRLLDADSVLHQDPRLIDSERRRSQFDIRPAQAEHFTAAQTLEGQAPRDIEPIRDALARNFLTSALLHVSRSRGVCAGGLTSAAALRAAAAHPSPGSASEGPPATGASSGTIRTAMIEGPSRQGALAAPSRSILPAADAASRARYAHRLHGQLR